MFVVIMVSMNNILFMSQATNGASPVACFVLIGLVALSLVGLFAKKSR